MGERPPARIVVLISGTGRNLQAIIDAIAAGRIHARIEAVISNRPRVAGLERAKRAGIFTEVLHSREFPTRADFDMALADSIDRFSPDIVALAGFMRILSADIVERFHGRMINIHPSLLPRHRGLHTHARALADGDEEHGASVHFVTAELDSGPVIIQGRVPVLPADDAASLAERTMREIELKIYPLAVAWLAEGRLSLRGNDVVLDGHPLNGPAQLDQFTRSLASQRRCCPPES